MWLYVFLVVAGAVIAAALLWVLNPKAARRDVLSLDEKRLANAFFEILPDGCRVLHRVPYANLLGALRWTDRLFLGRCTAEIVITDRYYNALAVVRFSRSQRPYKIRQRLYQAGLALIEIPDGFDRKVVSVASRDTLREHPAHRPFLEQLSMS